MADIKIALINESTVLQDADVQQILPDLQTQVRRDFAPVWGVDADLLFIPKGQQPPPQTWWMTLLDDSDQAGALGYHDLTAEGLPLGKVFAKSDLDNGLSWTVTLSHELLEMLGDPDINLTAFVPSANRKSGVLYAYEVCDACEDDSFGYKIGSTLVSDFVYPAWFESFRSPNSTPFDFQGKITQPFQLLKGGYIGTYKVGSGSGWTQLTARALTEHNRVKPAKGSRRERRQRAKWRKSARIKRPPLRAADTAPINGLAQIDHFVLLMLENRSFDNMLGFLYEGKQTPDGQPFEGLTGNEQNLDSQGNAVKVFKIPAGDPNCYFYPKANPGEGFDNTTAQLFGTSQPGTTAKADNSGFITNFEPQLTNGWKIKTHQVLAGTKKTDVMGMFTPDLLPVLSGLAKGYAVCDQWFCSAPTETRPNRAFAIMATSQGRLEDKEASVYSAPSIFHLLESNGFSWSIYGDQGITYTHTSISDIANATPDHLGEFPDFQKAVQNGTLANFVFLEPTWSSKGNSQHPNWDVAPGENLIQRVYSTLCNSSLWEKTLLIITYDEHGGCYDHITPPSTVAPDGTKATNGFDFTRLGVRVPAVLVSPWIKEGTVFRAEGPLDHTSLLKTVEKRFGLAPLTNRDGSALDIGNVLSLDTPRMDNVLAGINAPVNRNAARMPDVPSRLQLAEAQALAATPTTPAELKGMAHDEPLPAFKTGKEAEAYIRKRYAARMKLLRTQRAAKPKKGQTLKKKAGKRHSKNK